MSEFMGIVYGKYDAKKDSKAGGATLHSMMTPHGPDAATFERTSTEELKPFKMEQVMVRHNLTDRHIVSHIITYLRPLCLRVPLVWQ